MCQRANVCLRESEGGQKQKVQSCQCVCKRERERERTKRERIKDGERKR
jgi:hypothetical protein